VTRLNDPTRTHPHDRDLYTPITDELIAYLRRAHLEAGTWRNICEAGGIKLRQLRRIRTAGTTTVSMRLMDRIIVGSGVGSLDDWYWFSPEDLIRMGLWKEPLYVAGKKRYHRGRVWEAQQLSPYQRELAMRRKAAKRRRDKARKIKQAQRIDYKRLERDRFLEGIFR
jgi:hypothetical protein